MSGIMQEVATFVILGDSLQARAKIKNSAPKDYCPPIPGCFKPLFGTIGSKMKEEFNKT